MSIAPLRQLESSVAGRFVLTVLLVALTTAAILLLVWALVEALSPAVVDIHAPGPLPLPSPWTGGGGV